MKAATTKKVIRLRFSRLNRYSTRIGKEAGMEDIHKFRVEVKKLRAFLRLLQGDQDNKINLPQLLKKVYRKAGLVRNLQLLRQMIKDTNDEERSFSLQYLRQADKKKAAAIKKLKKAVHPGLLRRVKAKIEKKLPDTLPVAAIQGFYDQKITAIRHIVSAASVRNKQLHTIRKSLKDILYNAKIFKEDLSRRFPVRPWSRKKEDTYAMLTDELGKFQNICTALAYVEDSTPPAGPEEKKAIAALRRQQRQLKKQLLRLPEWKSLLIQPDHANDNQVGQ